MSSATLTDARRRGERQEGATSAFAEATAGTSVAPEMAPASVVSSEAPSPLSRTGFFFLITACVVATVAVVLLRGAAAPALVFVVVTIFAAGLTAVALYRTLIPLTGGTTDETPMLGGRTRAALERDKMLTLRAIKELEFDRAMGKVSEADFEEMRSRLRSRALRLLRQLEGGSLYRQAIEREVAARVAALAGASDAPAAPACLACGTRNDPDARFCKHCGQALAAGGAA